MNTNYELLEKKLALEISAMMGANLDRWSGDSGEALSRSASLSAQGIARKLIGSLRQHPGQMDADTWQRMVEAATKNAFIDTNEGPLLLLSRNPTFANTVAECTALTVAPVNSAWFCAIENKVEKAGRQQLRLLGVPATEIDQIMKDIRAAQRS